MRPSSILAIPFLLGASSLAIAITNAKEHTGAAPAPSPHETMSPPPPPAVNPPSPPSPPLGIPAPAWTPVKDVNDRTIQQVGQFSVVAYFFNTGTKLEFVNVVSGQSQPYNGGNSYRLVITVAGPGTETSRYSASVWGILGTTTWQLWSFAPS
ncbi:hypothetical protein QOZ80_3AG0235530 [Eleusine coracana subsp. coracana]|nr:hypothetical protein QOZ80_3AG0235530 [Eleusine coracana subsp. coracana]